MLLVNLLNMAATGCYKTLATFCDSSCLAILAQGTLHGMSLCRTLSAVQDIVYGFKSTQLFNVGDLFRDLSQCRDALQQLKDSSLRNSSCVVDVLQSADLASWQTHTLTGLQAFLPLLLDMRSCRCDRHCYLRLHEASCMLCKRLSFFEIIKWQLHLASGLNAHQHP